MSVMVGQQLDGSGEQIQTGATERRRGRSWAQHWRERETADVVVLAARNVDGAWQELVRRFDPLVRSTARRAGLAESDIADVCQLTWAALVVHIAAIREPACVPGWLRTTARRESIRVATRRNRTVPGAFGPDDRRLPASPGADEDLVDLPGEPTLTAALDRLSERDRRLVALLFGEGATYADTSSRLGMPVGSIGPTRERCLERLRRAMVA
jgi:RNA polymerase sigma factor (sigma-70 family)